VEPTGRLGAAGCAVIGAANARSTDRRRRPDRHFRLSTVSAEAASRSHNGSKVMFTAEA
jgi:hypothetical protein